MFYTDYLLSIGVALAYFLIFAIVFAESGLFFGFFLPGDSLLFSLGLLASQGHFSLPILLTICLIAAIGGDSVGYAFGRKVGPALFQRPNSRFFKQEHLERARAFYEEHGVKTIILARFVPFARTFAPILAGVGEMEYSRFILYNILGGVGWVVSMLVGGYFLGTIIPDIEKYILPIIGGIVILSVLPALSHLRPKR